MVHPRLNGIAALCLCLPFALLVLCFAANAASADDSQAWLDAHNADRSKHCAPALIWSAEIAASAQSWANQCTLNHQPNSGYGENLFWGTAGGYSPQAAVASWYGEIAAYSFAAPGFSKQTGHFTQVVWKSSTQFGCGKASCKGFDYWVCRYSPPGNVTGQFPANVLETSCQGIESVPLPPGGTGRVIEQAQPPSSVPLPPGGTRKFFKP